MESLHVEWDRRSDSVTLVWPHRVRFVQTQAVAQPKRAGCKAVCWTAFENSRQAVAYARFVRPVERTFGGESASGRPCAGCERRRSQGPFGVWRTCERTHSMQKSLKNRSPKPIRLMRFSCKLDKDISRLLRPAVLCERREQEARSLNYN